jgi:hypothetical protein
MTAMRTEYGCTSRDQFTKDPTAVAPVFDTRAEAQEHAADGNRMLCIQPDDPRAAIVVSRQVSDWTEVSR